MIPHLGHVALQNFIDYSRTNRFIQPTRKHSSRKNFDIYGAEFVRVEGVSNKNHRAEFSKD